MKCCECGKNMQDDVPLAHCEECEQPVCVACASELLQIGMVLESYCCEHCILVNVRVRGRA